VAGGAQCEGHIAAAVLRAEVQPVEVHGGAAKQPVGDHAGVAHRVPTPGEPAVTFGARVACWRLIRSRMVGLLRQLGAQVARRLDGRQGDSQAASDRCMESTLATASARSGGGLTLLPTMRTAALVVSGVSFAVRSMM